MSWITKGMYQLIAFQPCPSRRWTTTGRSASLRAATNGSVVSGSDSDCLSPPKKRSHSIGNTSIVRSPVSSFRVGTRRGHILADKYSSRTEVNGCKTSSHWSCSISSCHFGGGTVSSSISRRSALEGRGNGGPQSCTIDESCQSDGLHRIRNERLRS